LTLTAARVDRLRVVEHLATVDTASRLGYEVAGLDVPALEARYRGAPHLGVDRFGRYA
jgi:hypothetical protein